MIKYFKKIIVMVIRIINKLVYRFIKVNDNYIIFTAYHGRGYLCNPKYIHRYMINNKRYENFTFIWAVKNKKNIDIPNAKVVRYNGIMYFYYLAKCKYWIFNCKMPKYILKKNNQIYLQTWHGTPLKRLAHDIELEDDSRFYRTRITKREMLESYDIDSRKYNYFLSANKFSTEKFKSAFNIDRSIILEFGYPRNQYLNNVKDEDILSIKQKYNIKNDKKVILYAPTWRDDSFNKNGYKLQLNVDFNLWKKELGNEYIVILKPHYLIKNKYNDENLKDFLYCIDENIDINELYIISDMLITDYSSVFFDYAILEKPIYFYMYDLKYYEEKLRGFYLNIYNELPGDIVETEDSLMKIIKDYDNYFAKNIKKIREFNNKYNEFKNINSCEKILNNIIE